MAMEQPTTRKKPMGKGGKGPRKERAEGDGKGGRYQPKLLGKAYFQRKKGCPFSGPKAPKIDYKDVRLLQRYLSDYGKMLPRHISGVCAAKQRELALAIKRARMMALLPFAATVSERDERRAERMAAERAGGGERRPRGEFRGERSEGRPEREPRGERREAPAAEAQA
jgi:small subunit ribosomal protein S18